jgi:hypothetical protein
MATGNEVLGSDERTSSLAATERRRRVTVTDCPSLCICPRTTTESPVMESHHLLFLASAVVASAHPSSLFYPRANHSELRSQNGVTIPMLLSLSFGKLLGL